MIQAVMLLALASSSGFASEESALISFEGSERGSDSLVGEFSISPKIKDDLVVSNSGESLTAHSGIVMTESGQGGADAADSDSGNEDFNNDIYDKKKNTKKRKTEGDELDPYQWWTQANAHQQVHFMSTFNPS
ncbi:hypothetical protein [Candidatus Odyssella acanthamoebae]|uniref:Uncharacterized protein n=1 Tax=Candidatus Odyssella acanthamoebae TaxID=91604 RepID=A0A077AW53_9PROT|nr:hypothetical protein [Candidatus Paracaedibacter acanthamoebae]AIK95878.1 hypothetical protein ID47_02700 [Candidatus Paracaedibacter acanthamoebae]